MARRLGLWFLALALPWGACEDHTVELAQGGETVSTSDAGPTSTGSNSTSPNTSTTSSVAGDWGSASGGTQNQTTVGSATTGMPCTWPCQESGGTGGVGNHAASTAAGGMSGINTTTGFTTGAGNEGGQPPDCQDDPKCLICKLAEYSCTNNPTPVPTPDCPDTENWRRACDKCDTCQFGSVCYEGYQCRMPCEDQTCPRGEVCDPNDNACVHCIDANQCQDPLRPYCLGGECVECTTVDECPDERHYCISGRCLECLFDSECEPNLCGDSFQCVECKSANDCESPDEYCLFGRCEPA